MAPLFVFLTVFNFVLSPLTPMQAPQDQQVPKEIKVQQVTEDKTIEAPGVFSYKVPEGWRVVEVAQVKYKVAVATPVDGFAPNINIVEEEFKGSMDEYLQGNLKILEKSLPGFKNLGQRAFTTNSGVKGVKVTAQTEQQGKVLRQVFFLLRGKGDLKFVITFTALANDGNKYDAAVEKALKTFVLK